jgi:hypothetical protein
MISGLAQIVQRVNASTPLRYLSEGEIAMVRNMKGSRYRKLANERRGSALRMPALPDPGAVNVDPENSVDGSMDSRNRMLRR